MEVLMIRFRVLTGAALIALLAGGAAFAQAPARPGGAGGSGRGVRGPGGPGGAGLPLAQLNLTDAQREQIRSITEQRPDQGQQLQERLRAAVDAQRKAVETLPVNEGAIRAAAQELALAEAEVAIQRAHTRADVFAILTPEQQEQVKTLQDHRGARLQPRRDRLADRRR
jgi:periplasmic protein CpxP/Spy